MKEENEALHAAMASLREKHEASVRRAQRSAEAALAEAQGWLEEAQADAARFREEACGERRRVAELEREVGELRRRAERAAAAAATKTEVVFASAFANPVAAAASSFCIFLIFFGILPIDRNQKRTGMITNRPWTQLLAAPPHTQWTLRTRRPPSAPCSRTRASAA